MYKRTIDLNSLTDYDLGHLKSKNQIVFTEVLSQDEIDQLLTAIGPGDDDGEDFGPADTKKSKKKKNFNDLKYVPEMDDLMKVFGDEDKAAVIQHIFAEMQEHYVDRVMEEVFGEVDKLHRICNKLEKKVEVLEAENKRLRKALSSSELFD